MISFRPFACLFVGAAMLDPAPALAGEEAFEFWLSPTVSTDLDDDTTIELDTAQRFGSASDLRADTYFIRGWVHQRLSDHVTLGGAIELRDNEFGSDELRFMQQISARHGIFRSRLRAEQRFVENRGGRMGLRLRPRVGVRVPLDRQGRWGAKADVELFWTLRGTRAGGDTGVDRLRTQLGVSYEVTDNLSLGVSYVRQQSFEPGGPDDVSHAPLIGIDFSF